MKRILLLLALLLNLPAFAAPPTDASIERLLAVTKADSMIDTLMGQMEQSLKTAMAGAAQGRSLTAEQQKVLEVAPAKLAAVLRQELSWANLKPIYFQIYRETLEQSEVDGMIAFYESPAGQAMISKMPAILQKSMTATQSRLQSMFPRIDAAMKEALAEAGIRP